ncbi:MAG: CDP-2,3-bis-(O-geranylgeranyl)-sn-glycerol synthase [Thaumarchaeota archaeon]|nr:CDP-2,3-bis-(O-geranylgeranyl)-sn-glycerol synthase [Candidatus Calditenuaceae archaeon]MDW8042425.1 CDP-2,3-bis-(O-geranylgeranyl)-sn-glycerol synthase [Nitrososphaerota archaeon]
MEEGLVWRFVMALVYVFPAYVANGAPVVAVRLIGTTHPLDFGRKFFDGRRLLGDGKTVEGLVSALSAGILTGVLLWLASPNSFSSVMEPVVLSVGAVLGDVAGSFLKRRAGIERGAPVPVLDQLGFLVTALLLCWAVFGIPRWVDPVTLLLVIAFTGVLHLATNAGAYLLNLKDRWY